MRDRAALVVHPRNPNKHPAEQIRMLSNIIQHQGWRNPIVISARSGFVVAGHGRLAAALLLGAAVEDEEFLKRKFRLVGRGGIEPPGNSVFVPDHVEGLQ